MSYAFAIGITKFKLKCSRMPGMNHHHSALSHLLCFLFKFTLIIYESNLRKREKVSLFCSNDFPKIGYYDSLVFMILLSGHSLFIVYSRSGKPLTLTPTLLPCFEAILQVRYE